MRPLLLVIIAILINGCASGPRQSEAWLQKLQSPQGAEALPPEHLITGVPFIAQAKGHCGPTTLAMAMNWAGKMVTVGELAAHAYTPGMEGSLQSDLIGASRRSGMLAIPVRGFEALLREVAAGHPVIVFQNLALSWWPQWHYALVHGYNLERRLIRMHSGPDASKDVDFEVFESYWQFGEYWGLVVLPPDQLSAAARHNLSVAISSPAR